MAGIGLFHRFPSLGANAGVIVAGELAAAGRILCAHRFEIGVGSDLISLLGRAIETLSSEDVLNDRLEMLNEQFAIVTDSAAP
jgi:hypothetical protein